MHCAPELPVYCIFVFFLNFNFLFQNMDTEGAFINSFRNPYDANRCIFLHRSESNLLTSFKHISEILF